MPLTGHFVHAVDVDRFQELRFHKRENIWPAVRLPRSGINNAGLTILELARFENRERTGDVGADVVKRIVHGFDMTDTACQIEDAELSAHQFAHQWKVAGVGFDEVAGVLYGSDVEGIAAAGWIERIDNGDFGANLHETDCEIAAN